MGRGSNWDWPKSSETCRRFASTESSVLWSNLNRRHSQTSFQSQPWGWATVKLVTVGFTGVDIRIERIDSGRWGVRIVGMQYNRTGMGVQRFVGHVGQEPTEQREHISKRKKGAISLFPLQTMVLECEIPVSNTKI